MRRIPLYIVILLALTGCGADKTLSGSLDFGFGGQGDSAPADRAERVALEQDAPISRIAFGSCADEELPQPIWDSVLAAYPDRFLFLGDTVYGDFENGKMLDLTADLTPLHDAYAQFARIEGFQRLRQSTSVLAVWDDHDYGKNDAGAVFPMREMSKQMFLDFWQVPDTDARRRRDGLYFSEVAGPVGRRVQIIVLDVRSFRSPWKPTDDWNAPLKERYLPDPTPTKTMLGAAQWAWFEEQLKEPADLRLVVSSIQVLADGHGYERWGNFPHERTRLVELIKTATGRTVLLTGDQHYGALYRKRYGDAFPLYEVSSSSLNRSATNRNEPDPNRLHRQLLAENFGLVEVDWERRRVRLEIRDSEGVSLVDIELPLAIRPVS